MRGPWLLLVLAGGCTTLGPTPATTTITALPEERPEVDVQLAAAPGFYLSSAVVEDPQGTGIVQLSAVFEPARLLPVPGLVLGARLAGEGDDTQLEPVIGYRRLVGAARRIAVAGFAFGTHGEAAADDASYAATRAGAEVAVDYLVLGPSRFAELHVAGAATALYLDAEGEYCIDDAGEFGRMCPEDGDPPAARATAEVSGVYPSATLGVALDGFRHRDGAFHGARLALMLAVGQMPRVIGAVEDGAVSYASLGMSLSLAFGAD